MVRAALLAAPGLLATRPLLTSGEMDVLGLDRPGRPPGCRLVRPVQVRVRDDLVRRGRTPLGLVLRGVRVADQYRVVASGEGSMERGADAGVGLRADDDQPSYAETG